LGAGNVDTIADFAHGSDKIVLDHAVFDQLGLGSLPPSVFGLGAVAADEDQRIIYDQASGNLYYDADGDGAGAAVLFATLQGAPVLTASDFQVI
jgi:Ca2+-binding RTX toxin-like protein